MMPDQIQLLRRLVLNDKEAVYAVMGGGRPELMSLDSHTAILIKIAVLLSVDSDPATFQWAVELAVAAGVDDSEVFSTLIAVAPIIGMARLNSSLPHLMTALDIDVIEG